MKSDTIGKLAEALAKAQGMMEFAKKDSLNPHFKSKYADIAAVIEAIREPLSKNGLSYVQFEEDDYLITMLMHISGEWISGKMKLILSKQDMQGKGSAVTYARRFSLSSMVGIAQDDDDGNVASNRPAIEPKTPHWTPSPADIAIFESLFKESGWSKEDGTSYIQKHFSPAKSSRELNEQQFTTLCGVLSQACEERKGK